ncbi:hypothetical protein BG015_001512 [Linnemannia schmuckeri]|uniref:Uncharacterized protein n=1 Tax=Linnemannia schmuckeri TaxID=64567 RepID=A0A9P5RSF9_9FUNG|nr:hypothetical protein BG015_001512 [Linnemannia schmuckeri]
MPSTAFSSLKRRIVLLFSPSSSSSRTNTTATEQQGVDTAQTVNNKPNVSTSKPSPKRPKILKNLRLPWKSRKPSSKLPAQVPQQQPQDRQVAFQDFPKPVQAIHEPHQHRRILSRRSSGFTVGTDCHSLMDTHSEFSVPSPCSPVFRYRMLYGPSIENIENINQARYADNDHDHHNLFTSEDEFIKELDKELARASVHVMKKRNAKQLRLRLSIEGARPSSGSIGSSALSTPVSVVRCKTSRGTYDASFPSSPTTPTSNRSFLRCKAFRGTYDASGLSSPTTPTSARSFLSLSTPLKSPGFSQRFSSKVAPSPSSSRHASPKPPSLVRLTSFSDLQDHQGPFALTKKHIEHIQRIENRLRVLESSALQPALSEPKQQLQQQQPFINHTSTSIPTQHHGQTLSEEQTTSRHKQSLRTKPSLIRRVDIGCDYRTRILQPRRISATARTGYQSSASSSFHHAAAPRPFSFHDWGSRWSHSAASDAVSAATVIRPSRHNGGESTDRTERLLEQVKERVASRIMLESALWETEALLRQYETLVVQDWELKLDNLCKSTTISAAAAPDAAGQEQQQQQQGQVQMNERKVRNPQELPCELN